MSEDTPMTFRDFTILMDAHKNSIEIQTLIFGQLKDVICKQKETLDELSGFIESQKNQDAATNLGLAKGVADIKLQVYGVYGVLGLMVLGLIEIIVRGFAK